MKYSDIPALQIPQIKVIRGSATEVDPETKTAIIRESETQDSIEESYDYLVAASGLRRTWPSAPRSLTKKEYEIEATKHIQHSKNAQDGVVVIGGGMWLTSTPYSSTY